MKVVYALPRHWEMLKGVAPAGNLSHILTGKMGQNGKKFLGGLSMRQKLFKTAKTLQAI